MRRNEAFTQYALKHRPSPKDVVVLIADAQKNGTVTVMEDGDCRVRIPSVDCLNMVGMVLYIDFKKGRLLRQCLRTLGHDFRC